MAVYHVSTTGTKTTGASTPDDWTNANCYATIKAAMDKVETSADEVIVADGTYSQSEITTTAAIAATGTTIRVRSFSNDPDACIIQGTSATAAAINNNKSGGVALGLHFKGFTLKKSVTHTSRTVPALVFHPQAAALDCEFENCKINTVAIDIATGTSIYGFFGIGNSGHTPRTLRFRDCAIEGLTSASDGGVSFANGVAGMACEMINTTLDGITHTNKIATGYGGGIAGGCNITLTNVTIGDLTIDLSASTNAESAFSFFLASGATSVLTVNGLRVTGDTAISGGACGPVIATTFGPYTFNDIDVSGTVTSSPSAAGAPVSAGALFLANQISAQGSGANITARNCTGENGPVLYCSQGAGGVFTDFVALNCTARKEGIVYAGGWGDVTWEDFAILGCSTAYEPVEAVAGGGAIYAHNHLLSTRSKTTTIRRGQVIGCKQHLGGSAGLTLKAFHDAHSHDVVIDDLVLDSPGNDHEVWLQSAATALLNVTGQGLVLRGGAASVENRSDGPGTIALGAITEPQTLIKRGVVIGGNVLRQVVA